MSGKLYLLATPIGNLEDITLRALKIMKEADLIAAEDTRHTVKLLNYFNISKPLISYHRHNEEEKVEKIIKKLKEGMNIALVSDAGTPVISDPGEIVVTEAIKNNIEIISIPGPCALITGLIASGISAKEFSFLGFLPLNKKTRKEKLEEIKKENKTIILYEAPHKIKNTLNDLKSFLENRKIVLCRELTKIHEEYIRGNIDDVIKKIEKPKGEFVIVIEKNDENIKEEKDDLLKKMTLDEHYTYYKRMGIEKKEIIKKIAKDKNVHKNEIYKYFIDK